MMQLPGWSPVSLEPGPGEGAEAEHAVVVGNSSEELPEGGFRWTLFVRPSFSVHLLEKVVIRLHPTFSPSEVELTKLPFEFTAIGWGTFAVGVSCFVSGQEVATGEHELSFDGTTETTIAVTGRIPTQARGGKAQAGRLMSKHAAEEHEKFRASAEYPDEVVPRSEQCPSSCQQCYQMSMCQAVLCASCFECGRPGLMFFEKLCRPCGENLGRCSCGKILQD